MSNSQVIIQVKGHPKKNLIKINLTTARTKFVDCPVVDRTPALTAVL
jgi:hypothetical protein